MVVYYERSRHFLYLVREEKIVLPIYLPDRTLDCWFMLYKRFIFRPNSKLVSHLYKTICCVNIKLFYKR